MNERPSRQPLSFKPTNRKPPGIRLLRGLLLLLLLIAVPWLGLAATRIGPDPQLDITAALPGIGQRTPITIKASEPSRGLSRLTVELVQGDTTTPLADKTYPPRPFWAFWGELQAALDLLRAGKASAS